ncbi:hypothetical protein [Alteromonas sp. ASW11-130]|uniref:hypothetical protein n=1 Tax=Alteromonas sp. ASW11-130 TaxID=3015775 RepID=UPI00224295C5|nr:hypothetical protein [Alteromonas sp. ASW11-130]MCW8090309.1 hypothetical protein [Alteromonas sp. ASW11-130]
MNALYELSKLYAQEKISKHEYRQRRAKLVNGIIAGHESWECATTIAPASRNSDEITQPPASITLSGVTAKNREPTSPADRGDSTESASASLSKYKLWGVLLVAAVFIALFVFIAPSFEHHRFDGHDDITIIEENVDEDPAMQELNQLWENILAQKQITSTDTQQLQSVWDTAPANVKARFIGDLKETITLWESDFEREIEVGLTTQLLTELESDEK